MLKFLFITNSGEALPIAWRLQRKKHPVNVYIHNPKYRRNYNGLLPKVGMRGLWQAANTSDVIVFDMNKPVENKRDRALHKLFRTKGDGTYGPIADKLRGAGKRVIGCSDWSEQIELSREKGSNLAASLGIPLPKTYTFKSLKDGANFLKGAGKKNLWAFKPYENQDLDLTYVEQQQGELADLLEGQYKDRLSEKVDYLLQEKINGQEISTEAWWTGKKWTLFNHTIEDKTLMDKGLGPRIGSASNVVWLKSKDGLMTDYFKKLTPYVQRAGYVGPVDINTIVSEKDHKPYFLEFTPRMGYDAIYALLEIIGIGEIFSEKPKSANGATFGSSVRVSIPPYPYEAPELLKNAEGIRCGEDIKTIWYEDVSMNGKGLVCSGADGIIGVATGRGNTIEESVKNVYKKAESLPVGTYKQYRSDLGERAKEARSTLAEWGLALD
jgi:phosphoribosylamine--glycine ligase